MRRSAVLAAVAAAFALLSLTPLAGAQDEARPPIVEAEVLRILEDRQESLGGQAMRYQLLELRLAAGPDAGQTVTVETGDVASAGVPTYAVGDLVLVGADLDMAGNPRYYIEDRVRRRPLALLFALFVAVVVVVARWRGLRSLLAMALSFAVIFLYLLPRLAAGDNPVLVAFLAALVMIPTTFYLSHGLNRKTSAAVAGTLVALAFTALLAVVAVDGALITGYASEEASFLQNLRPGALNIRGLLLASIVIGLSGILDDITVSQAAVVAQLRAAAGHLSLREVYLRAMDVGQDHIASLVNTLVLVYTSAALPLLLLFMYGGAPIGQVVSYEIVAEEIVRTLVASIGLVLAVPLTTAIACFLLRAEDAADADAADGHGHAGHGHAGHAH